MDNRNFEKEILEEMEQQYQNALPPTFKEKAVDFFENHKWHTIFLVVLIIVTAIGCVPMHKLGDNAGVNSLAKEQLLEEIDVKSKEYKGFEDSKKQLDTTIFNLTQAAAEIGDVNVRMKDHEEKVSGLTTAIADAQALSELLDKQLAEKQQTSSQINSITNITPGATRTIKAGDYRCPGAIKAGTYKISGDEGNILLYDISNSIRVSKKLETLDGNEFTLTISEGEKLKIDKNVKITSMN